MKKGIYTFKDGTDSLIKKMVKELRRNGADLRRQCLVQELVTKEVNGQHQVQGVMVNGKKIKCGAVLSNANLKNTIEKLFGLSKLPKLLLNKQILFVLIPLLAKYTSALRKVQVFQMLVTLFSHQSLPLSQPKNLLVSIQQVALSQYTILTLDQIERIQGIAL